MVAISSVVTRSMALRAISSQDAQKPIKETALSALSPLAGHVRKREEKTSLSEPKRLKGAAFEEKAPLKGILKKAPSSEKKTVTFHHHFPYTIAFTARTFDPSERIAVFSEIKYGFKSYSEHPLEKEANFENLYANYVLKNEKIFYRDFFHAFNKALAAFSAVAIPQVIKEKEDKASYAKALCDFVMHIGENVFSLWCSTLFECTCQKDKDLWTCFFEQYCVTLGNLMGADWNESKTPFDRECKELFLSFLRGLLFEKTKIESAVCCYFIEQFYKDNPSLK